MKQFSFFVFLIFSISSSAQDSQWFELGTTWTFSHEFAFDQNQQEYIAEFQVTEILEYNGHLSSKIESTQGGLTCLSVQPPYYLYESNDSVFYSSGSLEGFELAYIFGGSESWIFPVISDFSYAEDYLITVMDSEVENIGGLDIEVLTLEYLNSGEGINEIYPTNIRVIEYVGALNFFVVPFGNFGLCDGEYNIKLRCFSSPSFDYQNPEFTSCTLSLDEVQKNHQIFFPNPAAENISWAEPIDQISVFDATGKLLLQKQINGEQSLSVEHLPSGFYTVLFQDGDTNFSQKIIIE